MRISITRVLPVYLLWLTILNGCGSGPGGESVPFIPTSDSEASERVTLSSNATTVSYMGSVTLSWSTRDVSDCVASGSWSGSKTGSGSETLSALTTDSMFRLTCSGSSNDIEASVNVSVAAPTVPTVSISADPSTVTTSGSTVLSWTSTNADTCAASGNWSGNQNVSGSVTRNNLTADRTYTLTCSGPAGSTSDSAIVTVVAPSAPVVNLSANPMSVANGGSTQLTWSSSNVDTCTASGDWSGNKNTAGSSNHSNLTADQTYTLTCTGAGGNASDTVIVSVAPPVIPAPSILFSASPSSVIQNDSTQLVWSSTDASDCSASGGWSGNKATSGSETTAALMVDSQFTLTCSGAGGVTSETVDVTVVMSNSGTALLSWNPPTENTDGSPLTDLAGFKIYYGTSPSNYSNSITLSNPGVSSHLIENLAASTWYFSMTAYNLTGVESSYSTEVNKIIN